MADPRQIQPGEGSPPTSELIEFLEEGFCPLLCGFLYINELTTLRSVCRSFRSCIDADSAGGVLREMSGLVFPAEWPAGGNVRGLWRPCSSRDSQCSNSKSGAAAHRSHTRGLSLGAVTRLFCSSPRATPECTGKSAPSFSVAASSKSGADTSSAPSAHSCSSSHFNLFSYFISLSPLPHLVEVSLHLDEEVHLAEFLLPVFKKLLEACDAVETLTLQVRLCSWMNPLKVIPVSKVFPRVKRLCIRHSFISRAVRAEEDGHAIYNSPEARRPRPHLLLNSFFPACEEVEVHEVPVGDSDPAFDRIDFVRRQEVRTVAHVLTCLAPNASKAKFTLSHVRDLPPLLRVLAEASQGDRPFKPNFSGTDIKKEDAEEFVSASRTAGFPCNSLSDITVFQTLPEEDQGEMTDDEGRQDGPPFVGQERNANGEEEVPGLFAPWRILSANVSLRRLDTIRFVVKDDEIHDTFESSLLPLIRRICPSAQVKYEGASSLPLAVAGRALLHALLNHHYYRYDVCEHGASPADDDDRPHTEKGHRGYRQGQRDDRQRRDTAEEVSVCNSDEATGDIHTFDLEEDGVSQGMVEMLREWIKEPGWMEVGLWNPIVERPPRLQFLQSSWHAAVVKYYAEILTETPREPRSARAHPVAHSGPTRRSNDVTTILKEAAKTSEEHHETGEDGQADSRSIVRNSYQDETDDIYLPTTSLSQPKRTGGTAPGGHMGLAEEKGNEEKTFVLPTVTVNHTLFAFDSTAFATLVKSLPQFVLALDPYNTSPQSKLTGPFPNLLGIQISICRWSKIFVSAESVGLAKKFGSQVRVLRLLDSNRLEYKIVDASTKAAVDTHIKKILDVCPNTCVVEYRRVSAEYTWRMETGFSDDTPPFSVDKLCRKGFRFLRRIDVPFTYDDLLPSATHCAVTVLLFVRTHNKGRKGRAKR